MVRLVFISFPLTGKNCGFIKFASVASADMAKYHMHSFELRNARLKVLDAEEPPATAKRKHHDLSM